MDISSVYSQSDFVHFFKKISLPFKFCEMYQFAVQGFSLVCAIM